jgi:ferredoxin-NADP reductase
MDIDMPALNIASTSYPAAGLSQLLRKGIDRLGEQRWLHPLNDFSAADALLADINPMWSLTEIRARIESVFDETPDTRSFWLRPNGLWQGFEAGQHVMVSVECNGVFHQRVYSLSSDPARSDLIRITVKRQAGGRVSNALHDQLQPGDVLTLAKPHGDFLIPASQPEPLLMIAGGSGMTPFMSQLQALHARGHALPVALVVSARGEDGFIFREELLALAARWPALSLHWHDSSVDGRLDAAAIARHVPDYVSRQTLICGPAALMDAMQAHWQRLGISDRFRSEAFGAPRMAVAAGGEAVAVSAERTEQVFTAAAGQPLLQAAEAAGLSPRYGCRIGICRSCQCRKTSGTVENLLTGAVSSAPDELIQLCISSARSDVALDL